MAYSTSIPPVLVTQGLDNSTGPKTWTYQSSDAIATITAAGYITNGGSLGMKLADLVIINVVGGLVYSTKVIAVSSTYPGAVNLATTTTTLGAAS